MAPDDVDILEVIPKTKELSFPHAVFLSQQSQTATHEVVDQKDEREPRFSVTEVGTQVLQKRIPFSLNDSRGGDDLLIVIVSALARRNRSIRAPSLNSIKSVFRRSVSKHLIASGSAQTR